MSALSLDKVTRGFGLLVIFLTATLATFSGGALAAIGIVGAVIACGLTAARLRKMPQLNQIMAGFVLLLLALCCLMNLQAAYPALSWHYTLQLASIVVPLLLFSSPEVQDALAHEKLFPLWAIATAVTCLLLGVELALQGPLLQAMDPRVMPGGMIQTIDGQITILTKYNRGLSYAMMFAWPLLAYLWVARAGQGKRGLFTLLFIAALLPALIKTESRATMMAAVFAVLTFGAALMMPALTRWGLQVLFVLSCGWPFAASYAFTHMHDKVMHLPASWLARVEIWDSLAGYITQRPLLGWGVGAIPKLAPTGPHAADYTLMHIPAGHAHNMPTQLWVELGVPGLVLGVVFSYLTLRASSRLPKRLVPFALAAWAGGYILAMAAYEIWTDSMLAMIALAMMAFALLARQIDQRN